MIVVAIIGVLAAIATYAYSRFTSRAKATEVNAIFTELSLRQEQHHLEHGRYLSTGSSESDMHPATPSGPDQAQALRPLPDTWDALRVQTDQNAVYCSYVAIAGRGGDDSDIGTIASTTFGFEAPMQDWYYLLAECDFDGNPNVNSRYFTASDRDGMQVENQGS